MRFIKTWAWFQSLATFPRATLTEMSLFGSASVRVNSEEDLNSQVLSPQGTGGQDKDIWQETRLTYCQVSVTLSLTQMMAPYTTSTKTDEGDSFTLRYHKLTCDVKALSSLQLFLVCTQAMSVVQTVICQGDVIVRLLARPSFNKLSTF